MTNLARIPTAGTKPRPLARAAPASFILHPKGPFSLARSADVIANFPPLRHQPRPSTNNNQVVLGFILDRAHTSVAVAIHQDQTTGIVHGVAQGSRNIDAIKNQVARILSLDIDATAYPDLARTDPKLASIMREHEGLRPVCFTSPYEAACWAVISQRIHTTQAAKIVAEIVRAHGETVTLPGSGVVNNNGGASVRVFPRPDRLLDVRVVSGLASVKLARLHAIAKAALDEGDMLDAETIRALGPEEGPRSLRSLPGIGSFWASGIYLRACGVADVFPDEPISIAALGSLHGLGDRPSSARIVEVTNRYRPFRMWVAFLLRVAAARGTLGNVSGREGAIRAAARRPR